MSEFGLVVGGEGAALCWVFFYPRKLCTWVKVKSVVLAKGHCCWVGVILYAPAVTALDVPWCPCRPSVSNCENEIRRTGLTAGNRRNLNRMVLFPPLT